MVVDLSSGAGVMSVVILATRGHPVMVNGLKNIREVYSVAQ